VSLMRYILTKLLLMIPTLFGLSLFTFMLLYLTPGGPTDMIIAMLRGQGMAGLNPAQIAALNARFGLNVPPPLQYIRWLENVLRGNLGTSFFFQSNVNMLILARLRVTLTLTVVSTLMALAVAIPLGVLSAVHRDSIADYLSSLFSVVGMSLPTFWLGFLLIALFSFTFHVLPAVGYADPFSADGWKYFLMPSLTLAIGTLAVITRLLRGSMLECLGEDYIQTARSKGLRERIVVYRHAFRNAMIPVVTMLGLYFGSNLGGVVTVETVFHYLGVGELVVSAIESRDYPLIQGVTLYIGVVFVLSNTIVDVIYSVIDPRIRLR
jgi:peptide/nickel transport system permease protein